MAGATPRVMLAWARDRDGARVHVGELDARRREARAPFTCPSCGESLVARLGSIRARHFAHPPGSACPLTAPETARHQNAKERIAWLCGEAVSGRLRVLLDVRCARCRRASGLDVVSVADGVAVEGRVGGRRADVLLTRAGSPSVAVEVRVAHAVDGAKEDDLAALGVPVLEVDAWADWERESGGGAVIGSVRSAGFPPCPSCATQALAGAGRAAGGESADQAELEGYRARGLLGPPPGAPREGAAEATLTTCDHEHLRDSFRCPECGGTELRHGERVVRHSCPGEASRAVAWLGYDGVLVEMAWWRRREPSGRA